MARSLPPAEVVRKYIDEAFDSHCPVLVLRWPAETAHAERLWNLPEGHCVAGYVPVRFGHVIRRTGPDAYNVRLVWDRTILAWSHVPRAELMESSLGSILAALGVDLWSMLEQPVPSARARPRAA